MNGVSYITDIRDSMPKNAWYELNWYLLHHDDMSIKEAFELYKKSDPDYTNWLIDNNIMDVDPDKSIESILLAYIQDYIEVNNDDGNINVQEYFKQREIDKDNLLRRG